MLLKLAGGITVICTGAFVGYYFAEREKKRVDFLECFNHDMLILKSRISEREKLKDAVNYVGEFSANGDFWKYWSKNIGEYGVRTAFEMSIAKIKDKFNLTKTDIKTMLMITGVLGKTDVQSQKEHIDYVFGMVKILINNARKECEINSRLYKSAGVMFGVLVVILLL